MIPIRLIGPRVLVALEPDKSERDDAIGMEYQDKGRTASGIILAAPSDQYDVEPHSRGIVVQLGEKSNTCDLDEVRSEVHSFFVSQEQAVREVDGDPARGNIRMLGDMLDIRLMGLAPAPFDVQVGDCVIFPPSAGIRLTGLGDDITYVELKESDIWAVIEPNEAA